MSSGSETALGFAGRDKRAAPRYGAHFDVRFARRSDAAKALSGSSLNFSCGGLCLRVSTPYEMGESLALSLTIEGELFELDGVVAWSRGGAIGVRFVNVPPELRDHLEQVAQSLEAKGQRLP